MYILDDRNVIAKKNHRCRLCGIRIPASSVYRRVYAVVDGEEVHRMREHLECASVATVDDYEMLTYLDFQETYSEVIDFSSIGRNGRSE